MSAPNLDQYLKVWKGSGRSDRLTDVFSLIERYRALEKLCLPISPVLYIWDIPRDEYLYFSKNVHQYTGCSAHELLTGGSALIREMMHPDDLVSYTRINQELRRFMRSLPAGAYQNYRLLYKLRVKKTKVEVYLQLLIEEVILQVDALGTPLLVTGKISDVSHLNPSEGASLYVTEAAGADRVNRRFFLYKAQQEVLSRREREVLDLLAEGSTNVETAERLHISVNTVKNHRKSMLKKTGANNTAALVRLIYG